MNEFHKEIALNVQNANSRIKPFVRKTSLEYSLWLSAASSCNVHIKHEQEQITNSFKARGATNKVRKICENKDALKKIVTASSGNHGLACVRAIQNTEVECILFLPTNSEKIDYFKKLNASVRLHGTDCVETEMFAKQYAKEIGVPYLSPYNDLDVIAGQGTIGLEVLEDLPDVDVVFVSVGGGGLISGVAAYLKTKNPNIKVIGCQPENSPVMYKSVQCGSIVNMESLETLSDGTGGGVDPEAITFDLCRDLVDDWVIASEAEISIAVYQMLKEHCKVIEGAAGLAIASFLKTKDQYKGKNVVIISCGGNISVAKLRDVIDRHHKAD